ncbi:hypothetical protein ACWEP4_45110, partial [Streptomyces sp. NPDC004227]
MISEIVLALEPELAPGAVTETAASMAKLKSGRRRLAEALVADPELLTSGRPEGPASVGKLIRALRAIGAQRVVLPRCAHCGKQHSLPHLDGDQRICAYCRMKKAAEEDPCVVCGHAGRDHLGRARCVDHLEAGGQDPVDVVCDHVAALDPGLTRDEVAAAVRRACQRPKDQRELALALEGNPGLLAGEGVRGPHRLILLIEELLARGARNVVLPACPFCGTDRKLRHGLDGHRVCRPCYEKFRVLPCSRCGRDKPVASKSVDSRPLCHPCTPNPPKDASMTLIEDDQRWAHVRRLVTDDGIDTATRVAGLLLLLFAQPLSRNSRIRLDQVTQEEERVTLALGSHPTVLPPPLDALVLEFVQQRYGYSALGRSDDHPWLFPGKAGGQPISSRQLMRKGRVPSRGVADHPAVVLVVLGSAGALSGSSAG